MNRLRKIFQREDEQSYERLAASETSAAIDEESNHNGSHTISKDSHSTFSPVEYSIFLLLGVSMLWAWNMFLAAGPYFQYLFRSSQWLTDNFQAAELSVSTITSFGSMLILTRLQARANYPRRIIASLVINMAVFALLAASTALSLSANAYFAFLMLMIFATSLATGFCQNGIFAYVSGFGQAGYTQGIMTGQAVAGVLPCIAQIVSVLSVRAASTGESGGGGGGGGGDDDSTPDGPPAVPWTSALAYFSTATAISVVTLMAFFSLLARNRHSWWAAQAAKHSASDTEIVNDNDIGGNDDVSPLPEAGAAERKSIPLLYLFRKVIWLALALFLTFAITMMYPIFTQQILSNRPLGEQGRLFQPPSFIPLAFLFWNAGDLTGRLLTAVPSLSLVSRPRVVFFLAVSRLVFVGLYHLCNIRGRGAIVASDFFYLVIVQYLFGVSNGYIGSICMIAAGEWVEPEEREATGSFMGLCLVTGLTVGSLATFLVANV